MEILEDTLELETDIWEDPGDYPNNVAGYPLPSHEYISDIVGELWVKLTKEEMKEMQDCIKTESFDVWVDEVLDYTLSFECPIKWGIEREVENNIIVIAGYLT